MSKIIAAAAIRGAYKIAEQARDIYKKAVEEKGADCAVAFPNTGYYIPIIYSMTGIAVEKLSDFEQVFERIDSLLPPPVDDDIWLPYLGHALDAVEWASKAEELGAGEILLTSMDADGTKTGYDNELNRAITDAVNIPVIASGGAGKPEHLAEVFQNGLADAAIIASMIHTGQYTIKQIKDELIAAGIPIRKKW